MSDVEKPISLVELRLAARNHAMPLEALRYAITPPGLHYLLTHYDIPAVEEATYRLEVDGLVATPLSLSLEELRARPAVETAVTMECAGNGRALIEPHVVSQPWLEEAVGTAVWRGRHCAGCCRRQASAMRRSRSCSPASTTAWREASSRRTSAASP
jgi:DMSO/TMAO reductase YedYZ molybdopterin-dependent catalytic subunit